jgi:hypothetical protein
LKIVLPAQFSWSAAGLPPLLRLTNHQRTIRYSYADR